MPIQGALPIGESAEEGRALLQVGVARRLGRRSARFSQRMESGGLLLNLTGGALLGRCLVGGFARTQASARIWWLEHRLALDDKGADSAPDTGAMRTIAVAAAPRSPANEVREPTIS